MRSIMKYFHYTNHQTHLETDHCVPPALSFIGKNLIVTSSLEVMEFCIPAFLYGLKRMFV